MQTTYRLDVQEIDADFLQSLKTLFAGKEVEIIVRPVKEGKKDQLTENPTFNAMKLKTKGFKFDRNEANAR